MSSKNIALAVLGTVTIGVAAGAITIATGVYNVEADDQHTPWVTLLLTTAREKSIERCASGIRVLDLSSAGLIRTGAVHAGAAPTSVSVWQSAQRCAGNEVIRYGSTLTG